MRIGAGIGSRGTMEVCWTLVILYAVFVLFGQNIGTCVTALLSAIGAKKNAKRAAKAKNNRRY